MSDPSGGPPSGGDGPGAGAPGGGAPGGGDGRKRRRRGRGGRGREAGPPTGDAIREPNSATGEADRASRPPTGPVERGPNPATSERPRGARPQPGEAQRSGRPQRGGGGRPPEGQRGGRPGDRPRGGGPPTGEAQRGGGPATGEGQRAGGPPTGEASRGPRRDERGPRRDERGPRRDDRGRSASGAPAGSERGPRRDDRGPRRDDRGPRRDDAGRAPEGFPDEGAPGGDLDAARPTAPAALRPSPSVDAAWGTAPSRDLQPAAPVVEEELGPIRIVDEAQAPRDADVDDVFIDLTEWQAPRGQLVNLTGVKFREAGTIFEYDAGDVSYQRGDRVVVESERGPIVGMVAVTSRRGLATEALRKIVKRAGADDDRARVAREKREQEAFVMCRERVRERRMPMKLIRAELSQGSKILFYFASEERIDFRDLVKDLSHKLHGRIELRQVGARDEAKMVGGIGDCGRELCCSTFLPSFAPVSIKMAKDQGLVLNPSRVTGQCGRLKCCLVYEHALYQEMRKSLPKVGKRVSTPAGDGRVVELDVLRQQIRVGFVEGGTQTFPAESVAILAPPPVPGRPAVSVEPEPEPDPEPDPDPDPTAN